jgi:hypothetical protein
MVHGSALWLDWIEKILFYVFQPHLRQVIETVPMIVIIQVLLLASS